MSYAHHTTDSLIAKEEDQWEAPKDPEEGRKKKRIFSHLESWRATGGEGNRANRGKGEVTEKFTQPDTEPKNQAVGSCRGLRERKGKKKRGMRGTNCARLKKREKQKTKGMMKRERGKVRRSHRHQREKGAEGNPDQPGGGRRDIIPPFSGGKKKETKENIRGSSPKEEESDAPQRGWKSRRIISLHKSGGVRLSSRRMVALGQGRGGGAVLKGRRKMRVLKNQEARKEWKGEGENSNCCPQT